MWSIRTCGQPTSIQSNLPPPTPSCIFPKPQPSLTYFHVWLIPLALCLLFHLFHYKWYDLILYGKIILHCEYFPHSLHPLSCWWPLSCFRKHGVTGFLRKFVSFPSNIYARLEWLHCMEVLEFFRSIHIPHCAPPRLTHCLFDSVLYSFYQQCPGCFESPPFI